MMFREIVNNILNYIKLGIFKIKNLKFLKNLDKKKINSILTLAIFIILLDIILVLRPQINQITKNYLPKRRKIVSDLKTFKRGINTVSDMEIKLKNLENTVEQGLSQLTSEKDIPRFLSWVSAVAEDNNIKLMNIKPQGILKVKAPSLSASLQERFYLLPITLSLRGGYHQLGSFLNKLEQGNYFVKITDLVIKSDSKGTGRHEINLRLETFILKE